MKQDPFERLHAAECLQHAFIRDVATADTATAVSSPPSQLTKVNEREQERATSRQVIRATTFKLRCPKGPGRGGSETALRSPSARGPHQTDLKPGAETQLKPPDKNKAISGPEDSLGSTMESVLMVSSSSRVKRDKEQIKDRLAHKPAAELPALPSRARPVLHAAHCLARNQPGSTSNTFGQTTMLGVLI